MAYAISRTPPSSANDTTRDNSVSETKMETHVTRSGKNFSVFEIPLNDKERKTKNIKDRKRDTLDSTFEKQNNKITEIRSKEKNVEDKVEKIKDISPVADNVREYKGQSTPDDKFDMVWKKFKVQDDTLQIILKAIQGITAKPDASATSRGRQF